MGLPRAIAICKALKTVLQPKVVTSSQNLKTLLYSPSKTIAYFGTCPVDNTVKSRQFQMTDEDGSRSVGPVKVRLDSPEFRSLFTPGLVKVKDLFQKNGFELCFAGGIVRDLLMGLKPKDVDFATTATPSEMIDMFQGEEYRIFNEGGQSHGTVSCRVCEENFEITTLRIDCVTDGRHAEVEFTKDWYLDASRRDLTVNSMFLDLRGNVVDFFGGTEDLVNKKVRFVGSATKRIREDYLRILRFFRFFGRIVDHEAEFDEEAIVAIRENGRGLMGISGPRIWTEMTQILNGRYISKIMRKMYQCGLLPYIGFPEEVDMNLFEEIYNKTLHLNTNHMTYASALLQSEQDVLNLERRVAFSRNERKIAFFIVKYRDKIDKTDPQRLKFCQDVLVDIPPHEGSHKAYLIEVLKYIGDIGMMQLLQEWEIPKFPINGKMLADAGVPKGKVMGSIKNDLKEKWKESHYLISAKELIEYVPKLLEKT